MAFSSAWLLAVLDAFAQLGLDPRALCREAGLDLDALRDPESRVSRDRSGRVWRAALRSAGDPLLGLHAGERVRFRMNHLVPLLMMSARTLGEGVEAAVRYQELLSHGRVVTLHREGTDWLARLHQVEDELPILAQEVEFMAATHLNLFHLVTAPSLSLREVRFAHPACGPAREYQRVFGCPVRFSCEHTELRVDGATWNAPLPHHNPWLQAQFHMMAASLHGGRRDEGLASAASERLRGLLPGGKGDIERVAAALGLSPRTLQRRLREEGTSFRDVLDATRRRIVMDCLERRAGLDVWMRLGGFSDVRALRRALRRWELPVADDEDRVSPGG